MSGQSIDLQSADHVAQVASQLDCNITVVRQLAGGWNNGALLVDVDDVSHVLKLHGQRDLTQLRAIREICELGLANGWPTPKWKALGLLPDGLVWSLQEFIVGSNPHVLTEADARAIVKANERQAGLALHFPASADVLFDRTAVIESMLVHDEWGHLERLSTFSPEALRLVESLRELALPLPRIQNHDLVHGDFNQENILIADGSVAAFIDTDEIGRGSRYFDLVDLFHRSFQKNDPTGAQNFLQKTVVDAIGPKGFAACLATTVVGSMNWMIERMPDRLPSMISRLSVLLAGD